MYRYFLSMLMMLAVLGVGTSCPAGAASPPTVYGPVLPSGKSASSMPLEEEALVVKDMDEDVALPPYPARARIATGRQQTYTIGEEDTLLDIARYYKLGFVEIRAANPDVDPWTPVPGESVIIPSFRLLPRTVQQGIVVNLAQMRLYYFRNPKKEPLSFPIGIGREGLQTPVGETTVIRKAAHPIWFPTDRMREEKPWLPAAVPSGPSNPLGLHALYLGWPTFLIHGSNKPWAIGRRVSSGCMRMYAEDIAALFRMVSTGTKVTVVEQPVLAGRVGDALYLEVNPSRSQSVDIEIDGTHAIKGLSGAVRKVITDAAGEDAARIDWEIVKRVVEERRGYPVVISKDTASPTAARQKPASVDYKYTYN